MKRSAFLLMFVFVCVGMSYAQLDSDGCKDHPLLSRLDNFYIAACDENFNELQLKIAAAKTETKDGNLFYIYYRFNGDSGAKPKSAFKIIKNYELAISKNGGRMVYKNTSALDADIEATYHFSSNGKEYWVQLTSFAGTENAVEAYALKILEMEAMKQEVVAGELFEAIQRDGFVALYINFETGKSVIKPESEYIIGQIVEMLKSNPNLKISVDGHTDNVGSNASNQTLSENRAKAVMGAVVSKGIAASRLKSKGLGSTKPVADNSTEEGRAKNRRVEIVKQ